MGELFSKLVSTLAVILVMAGFISGSDLYNKILDDDKSWKYPLFSGLLGGLFGIYGNLKNYTMNVQPGWPMSVVTWDDHENNAHKTKLSVAMDGRPTDKWGWVFLVKGPNA